MAALLTPVHVGSGHRIDIILNLRPKRSPPIPPCVEFSPLARRPTNAKLLLILDASIVLRDLSLLQSLPQMWHLG